MIIPPFLKKGDKVGIVATAKKVDKANTLHGIEILKNWGLEVITGNHVFSSFYQYAGTDDERFEDLQNMLNNHELKALFMVRGGYGSTRIIDRIDFNILESHPKWICGFSDITAFNLHLYNIGIASFHAPMPSFFHVLNQYSLDWCKKAVFGEELILSNKTHILNRQGTGEGRIIGGNLSIICHTIGTPSEIKTGNNILFIEDVGEQLYNLDRMMVQLSRSGLLNDLSGLIVGQFSDMKDNEDSFGYNANEIILSHVADHKYPVAFDFPIGHSENNCAIPVGFKSKLKVDKSGVILELGQ